MKRNFNFVEKKNLWLFISGIFIIIGISLMIFKSIQREPILNYGIDFVGGNTFLLKLNNQSTLDENIASTRLALAPFGLEKSQIQASTDNNLFIKTTTLEKNITTQLLNSLKNSLGEFEVLEIDFIGPSIGKSLRKQSLLIVLFVSAALLIYITLRFQISFGIASVFALLHDSLIIFSCASIFNLEINTPFIAAILTILGYSINDTIVIFDRIREQTQSDEISLDATSVNYALNQTLTRTINTSLTTLIVIASLIFFGGSTIREFCIILAIGILSGTYSSLCIASPLLVNLDKKIVQTD
mgnify:CR=1 FL=1|tara:strand:+ start:527 stop:1423 length:897 start_codon:yes stop_codon:yes gene_type:complete